MSRINQVIEVDRVIKYLLPDEKKRKLCLEMFVEAIIYANSQGGDKWGIYYLPDRVRLLVGSLIAFTIVRNNIWLALDDQLLEASEQYQHLLEESDSWQWDIDGYLRYKVIRSKNGYYTPAENHVTMWPIIRALHFEYINKVAEKYTKLRRDSQAINNPVVLDYLHNELEKSVPYPNYGQVIIEDGDFVSSGEPLTDANRMTTDECIACHEVRVFDRLIL